MFASFQVILHVRNGARLGLKIRGGMEYGLGIYVSSVDRNHVAQKCGIRVIIGIYLLACITFSYRLRQHFIIFATLSVPVLMFVFDSMLVRVVEF